jgi:hypothetical protein
MAPEVHIRRNTLLIGADKSGRWEVAAVILV